MPSVQYKHSDTRQAFEQAVFQAYFISQISRGLVLSSDCMDLATLCKRDATGTDYERTEISAAWFGWCLSRDRMNEHMPVLNKRVPIPAVRRLKAKRAVPPAVRAAAEDYKLAYKAVYGIPAGLKWDGVWIRVQGQTEGVTVRRLREMTTQLKRRSTG